jgi:hypothetical protein
MSSSDIYRVLGGILALKEFSPDELARFADVEVSTVRRILSKEASSYVAEREPGGAETHYSLISTQSNHLARYLRVLERSEGLVYERDLSSAESMPPSLSVAEDILLRRLPGAVDDLERSRFISIAKLAWEDADNPATAGESKLSTRAQVHWLAVESALRLSEAELAASRIGSVRTDGLKQLWTALAATLHLTVNAGESELVQLLSARYLSSPIGQLLAQSQFAPVREFPIQSRPVLLFDVYEGKEPKKLNDPNDAVDGFIRHAFEESHISYTKVPLFESDADSLEVPLGGIRESASTGFEVTYHFDVTSYVNLVQPVCILPLPSHSIHYNDILSRFNSVCKDQPNRLV